MSLDQRERDETAASPADSETRWSDAAASDEFLSGNDEVRQEKWNKSTSSDQCKVGTRFGGQE
jgi:hypothetical protein